MSGTFDFTIIIRTATEGDLDRAYDFVFARPDDNLRKRSRDEVAYLIENGLLFLAIREDTDELAGLSYLQDPDENTPDWEFGGAFVDKSYRGKGIFGWMGLACIVNLYAMVRPTEKLIAHVKYGNPLPVGPLKSLYFKCVAEKQGVKQAELPGLEHMMPDDQGFVYADFYEFQQESLIDLVSSAAKFSGSIEGKGGIKTPARIELGSFQGDSLQQFLKELESKES